MEAPVWDGDHGTRPTWVGWIVICAAPVFVLAGLIRADVAMVIVGLLFAVMAAGAYGFARFHGRRMACEAWLPRHVTADRDFSFRLCLTNQAVWCDVWGVRVVVSGGTDLRTEGRAGWIPASGSIMIDLQTLIAHRGVVDALEIQCESDAPLGLMRTCRTMRLSVDLVVRPKPVWPWRSHHQGERGLRSGEACLAGGWGGDGELKGMRAWRGGDKPRTINWPATLRSIACGSAWLVRESDPPVDGWAGYTVVFHSYGGGGSLIRPGRFEEALSHAAGVITRLCAEGRRVRFVADFHDWVPWDCRSGRPMARCLDALALARRAMGTEAHELRSALENVDARDGIIILSDFPATAWQEAVPASAARAWVPPVSDASRRRKVVTG